MYAYVFAKTMDFSFLNLIEIEELPDQIWKILSKFRKPKWNITKKRAFMLHYYN